MNTKKYLAQVRKTTGYTDYKVGKNLMINQAIVSGYSTGKQTLSEIHAFQFSEILNIPVGKIIADTKLENATIKNNAKKIAFWTRQVSRLKSGLKSGVAGAFVFAFLALSPVDDVYANENQTVTQSSSYFYIM